MGVHRHNFALAVVSGLPVVAAITVGLRFLARWRRRVPYAWDDWFLAIATLLCFGLIAPSVLDIREFHWGYHVWEFPTTTFELTNRDFGFHHGLILSFHLLSIPILPLAKASMLLLLLRIGRVLVPVRRYLYFTLVFNILSSAIPWAVFIFICPPATGGTSAPRTFGNLHCLNRKAQGKLLLFINCANLMTDFMVFPVPFFIMRELMNTNWRSKLTIILTFASSLFVTVLSSLKIQVTYRDRIRVVDNPDYMWSLEYCITHGEAVVGIIVACIPTLRGLISRKGLDTTAHGTTQRTTHWRSTRRAWSSTGIERPTAVAMSDYGQRRGQTPTVLTPHYEKAVAPESERSSTSELIIQGSPRGYQLRPQEPVQHTFHPTPPPPAVERNWPIV